MKKVLHILNGNLGFFEPKGAKNAFDMFKWLKKQLKSLGVSFVDPCCPADTENLPVRYNQDLGQVEFYNPTTQAWEAV